MKMKTAFVCQQCGQTYSKWMGRCQECGEWNSVVEEITNRSAKVGAAVEPQKAVALDQVTGMDLPRIASNLQELDTVLGGGLVPGSVTLIGGEPGIGKSTLLLQASAQYALGGRKVLYASGEESSQQIALRAQRMGIRTKNLWILPENRLELILARVKEIKPEILVIDSVQTVQTDILESQPGSVGQLRECTGKLVELAKTNGLPCFLVGHVTKEGNIAGPKVLEHLVDTVLYFEGMSSQIFRILRSIKNRFGSTNEIGVFEMAACGLKEVKNPSAFFLSEKRELTPGSIVGSTVEGSRPLLVEIQALVSRSYLTIPRRTAIGLDSNRLSLLVAVLEKRAGFTLFDQDVYANVAGGLRLTEPATDLAVIAALISSHTGKNATPSSVFIGEVGLGGEVRNVPRVELRLKESARMGFKTAFCPKRAIEELNGDLPFDDIRPVEHVEQLKDWFR
ncbi:MAG: DNA repair protein RadA [Deltaproteobacteria bacterium]|nr:DNA repair protein RadA [Deltaproteobacteria bacterium]MBI3293785.1 DNA repair protein RadA [Deltaproteobacteria bacterium]